MIKKKRAQRNIVGNEKFKLMLYIRGILEVWSVMGIYLKNPFLISDIPHNIFHNNIGRQNQSFIHQTIKAYLLQSKK